MINQILQTKLNKYYEAVGFGHFTSSTFQFFDIINILSVIKNKKVEIMNFNKNWELLHSELFEDIFKNFIKRCKKDISKEEFNSNFKIIYEQDERVKSCKENLFSAIKISFPILISHLNIKPKKIISPEGLAGDLGVNKFNI